MKKTNVRLLLRVVIVAIALGVFGWQWLRNRPGRTHATGAATSAARAAPATTTAGPAGQRNARAGSVKRGLSATMQLGSLTLTACQLTLPRSAVTAPAFCARFPVPENRADPHSRAIDLKLAIVKSASQVPKKDLVVYLAGGPGQSAIQTYLELQPAFAPLRKRHDILLLDQRGTGGSHPLACPGVAKKIRKLVGTTSSLHERARWVGECAREVEKTANPRDYTTTAAVADLEAVRRALGSPKLDLVGVSYGTRVAQHYAQAYPNAVRSIVLDGVVPNQMALGETFAGALRRSLKLQAAACTETPACKNAFGNWYRTLHQLYDKLKTQPPRQITFDDPFTYKPVTRTLDAHTLASLARLFSYSAATQALLPLAVDQAAEGDYAPLMGQSQLMTTGVDASMQGAMQFSVVCTEDAPLLKPRPENADTLLGNQIIDTFIAVCKQWPHDPMPKRFHAPFQSSIPTLLISGERDPVTPPADATEVLQGLSDGRSLVVNGMGHAESINAGCMPRLVREFVDRLDPKKLDAECVKKIGPIPAFLSFNGAAP